MNFIHKFYCEMYHTYMTVCFHRETFCRTFGWEVNGDFAAGVNYDANNQRINIYVEGIAEEYVDDLCHEAFHAADYIFDRAGVEYKAYSGNEHMAYLLSWIVRQVIKAYNREQEWINGKH